jgi:hypothetical protein
MRGRDEAGHGRVSVTIELAQINAARRSAGGAAREYCRLGRLRENLIHGTAA